MNPTAEIVSDTSGFADELLDIAKVVLGLDGQHQFLMHGYTRVDDLWSVELADALAAEARIVHPRATWPEARPGPETVDSINRSPARQVTIEVTPLLAALHESLTRVARVLSARMVVPSVGTYGYYEHDDGCYLHLDTESADVTFLINVLGELGPLHVHPELVGLAMDDLHALEADPAWDRQSGQPLQYPRRGVAAIRGRQLPHHRPGAPVSGLHVVGAIHYRALF